jgi:PAS domain S-box-containing protein
MRKSRSFSPNSGALANSQEHATIREHDSMSEREYLDTLCNTADGVFIVDAAQYIIRWNAGAEKILGYSEAEVINHQCYQVIAGKASPDRVHCSTKCRIHDGVQNAPQRNFDILTQTKDGNPIWLNISILSPPKDSAPFLAHIMRDITREKTTDLALAQFLADLGARSATKRSSSAEQIPNAAPSTASDQSISKSPVALSEREIEVLILLAEGLSTKMLAQRLNISHFTARNHIQNILVKLDLHSKAQAVSYAFKRGIL